MLRVGSFLESMLLGHVSKILFRQHRPGAEVRPASSSAPQECRLEPPAGTRGGPLGCSEWLIRNGKRVRSSSRPALPSDALGLYPGCIRSAGYKPSYIERDGEDVVEAHGLSPIRGTSVCCSAKTNLPTRRQPTANWDVNPS
jgi:hypothetical protein